MSKIIIGHQIVDEDSIKDTRDKDNFYPTPLPFVEWMVDNIVLPVVGHPINGKTILDPGVGTGHFGKVLHTAGFTVYGAEINLKRYSKMQNYLYVYEAIHRLSILSHMSMKYDFIVGNPPYARNLTNNIVKHMWDNLLTEDGQMFLLLPSNFRHGVQRSRVLPMPSKIFDLVNRVNFKTVDGKGGSYPGEYAIFVWDKNWDRDYYKGYRVEWN